MDLHFIPLSNGKEMTENEYDILDKEKKEEILDTARYSKR